MRQSKRVFLWSLAIAVLALITTIYLFVYTDRSGYTEVIYDIMVNVFGGAIIGVFITLVEYNTVKKACLRDFLLHANYMNRGLLNPPVLYYSDTQYYSSKGFDIVKKPQVFRKQQLEEDVYAFVDFLKKVSCIDRTDFDNSYSALDFLFGNKIFRSWVNNEIYLRISKYLDSAYELVNYIEVMGVHADDYNLLVKKCKPIVEQWFYIDIEDNVDSTSCTVYSNQKIIHKKLIELQDRVHKQEFKPDNDMDSLSVRYRVIQKRNDTNIDEESK